ncbi:4-(cytidine 5'-diphospho)-2-C-methyl-D-erythritol kinase [Roseibium denhamense]|uniref:4-diphosphocytidyl-2-C-methyl-D-erythritol kinase n=1 Tax=Roseibium denhamense TaxID=76305 RepID=A0ABY1N5J9_9HYPH|nr:4-(cytidine 5'-diphospho)-2-C-methyl-D-erythritol kinase [Roseibium denhamense]MTI04382.1 4-(cytidine 5'-diphospho)-2-C-methyl-D-erythritol kinase [Roseibium denhamense]SMP00731.1 4-diphosphocytidyl-2-C-methyl-D-erythritol kinase [Roseibium denhamense]
MTAQRSPACRASLARAKVNLALHITGQRADGYHLLDSLVAFPQIGDRVAVEPADTFELVVDGPFARDLVGGSEDNLIVKAAKRFAETASIALPKVKLTLTKRLPVASGIGGGSSDAATALRLLEQACEVSLDEEALHSLALSLGADVPVCLQPQSQIMRGIGDSLQDGPVLPEAGIILVNPKQQVSTPAIFKALANRDNAGLPDRPEQFDNLEALASYLADCRNDMQTAAIDLCPAIGTVLTELEKDRRIKMARMSGSGATCFALCPLNEAIPLEREIRANHPDWWVASGPLA